MAEYERDLERGQPPDGGDDPAVPEVPDLPELDPEWKPSDAVSRLTERFGGQLRDRPRDRLWFPHLLIRGAPGDTGNRPLWEPVPCWASPDIHLLPEGAEVDLTQTVQKPQVGQRYAVAVHVWNLGRFPAYGVAVRAWWVEPGFFAGTPDPRYQPRYIGGTFTELGDRDSGRAHRIVRIPQPWLVEDQADGHECLFAVVDAFADPWGGVLAANSDRHVAQRNVTLIRGAQDTASILDRLGQRVAVGERIGLHLGTVSTAPLGGATERGVARFDDPAVGRGPLALQRPRRLSALVRTDGDWLSDRLRRRGGAERSDSGGQHDDASDGGRLLGSTLVRAGADRLQDVIALLLGAAGTTAREFLASPHLRGQRSAALHVTTEASGYAVVLQD